MSEWREVTIRQVARHVTVGFVGSQAPHFVEEGVPLLRGQNIKPYVVDLSMPKFISRDTHMRWKKSSLEAGDVVIVRVGYPGTAAVIPPGLGPLNAASLVIIRPDPEQLDSHFLAYLLNSPWGKAAVSSRFVGAAQQVLNTGAVAELALGLPDIATQRSITGVLKSIGDLIENNRRRVAVLEEMARAIYREWFVKFRYPGHENVPLVDSPLGSIPQGWAVESFSDLAEFVNGFAFKPAHWGVEGRPIVKIRELKQGVTAETPRHPADAIGQKYWIEPGDLLFSWSAYLGVFLWDEEPALLNQHLFQVKPKEAGSVSIAFLFHALNEAMPQFWARAQGTTMRHIKRTALSEVQTLLPPVAILDGFTSRIDPIHNQVGVIRRDSLVLAALRDLLLPKLVTGKIDVSNLDLDRLIEERTAS